MLSMRKIPIPLLIAAVVATTAVVIMLRVTVVPVPLFIDPNFTGPIPQGNVAVWRGAFSEATFAANATVTYYYAHGFKFAVFAPHGIHNVTQIRYGEFIHDIRLYNLSGNLYLTVRINDIPLLYKLTPTGVSGFYKAETPPFSEVATFSTLTGYSVFVVVNSGFDANNRKFFITYSACNGCGADTLYINPVGTGSGNSGTVRGYDITLNVDNKPIVVRTGTAIAFLPSQNTQVTIYVR